MAAPPARIEISDTYPNPTNDTARAGFGKLWDYVTGLLGMSGNKAGARAALGIAQVAGVRGLIGNPDLTTPLTKFNLMADAIVLQTGIGGDTYVTSKKDAFITCDLGLAGPVANGRDQAAAFTANSWVNLFFIWNGTQLALIASALPTPTLPAGFTYSAYATTIRWNASSNIIPVLVRGCNCWYVADDFSMTVVSGLAVTTFTTTSCALYVPPNALRATIRFWLNISNNTNFAYAAFIRPTGSTLATGRRVVDGNVWGTGMFLIATSIAEIPLDNLQRFDVRLSSMPTSGGLSADVYGYAVPNGDS